MTPPNRRAFIRAAGYGTAAVALGGIAVPAGAAGLELTQKGGTNAQVTVARDGSEVLTYCFGPDLPKPYVHPLLTPAGHEVTRLGPQDHIHHRALMFALGNVAFKGEESVYVVFWGEAGAPERVGHIKTKGLRAERDGEAVQIHTDLEWRRLSDDALMLTEARKLTVHPLSDTSRNLLTWETVLKPAGRDLVLGPTEGREVSYYGLGNRTPQDMDGGRIFDANGKEGEANVLGDDATWCAYVGPNEPQRGFVMFDHPDNPRHPTGWFVMSAGFGYMTASIVCHEPYELRASDTLTLRYGVCAFDGEPSAEEVEGWYGAWAEA